ncbi:MAG: protein arginine kinase [Candidatus Eisenbacteria bacterium]|uniref:Protein-arginine kinase n=1 Tax=Eiseniibacteriota bacterium TaxID=2212470 RepID=A0A538TYD5_UNCEI|nr:MAG: protein arginine kinase [Candidatus Eisenbacteria bacterium]
MTPPLKTFDDLVGRASPWLDGSGPHADLVVSTRVRLARNLAAVPFTHRARDEQLQGVFASVTGAADRTAAFGDALTLRMNELSALDRQILVERHLVSHELSDGVRPRGIVIGGEERLSLMVNEEDHLRLQAMASGFQLAEAWRVADGADDELDRALDFAFSEEIGYLTSCPTNTGTGLRASVLIHLPALVLLQEIHKVLKSIMQVGLNVRGLYGEHSDVMGNLFQISNQTTLGQGERDSIESLERVTRQVLETEERARERLTRDARVQTEDKVWRAYGLLRYCRAVSSQEVINLCSAVRLGVSLALPGLCPLPVVNELLVLTQPGHLQRHYGGELTPPERNVFRAQLVRERLAAAERNGGPEPPP